MKKQLLALLLLFTALTVFGQNKLQLPHIFSDNMVLQQDKPIIVWGKAAPGSLVEITLNRKTTKVKTDTNGKWKAVLPAITAGGPYEMTVKNKPHTLTFKNILIGEVWIASGQSNMQWDVARTMNAETEIGLASYPEIRLFTVENQMSAVPLDDFETGEWVVCTPETVGPFSAVGYFFARNLHQSLSRPVGIINTSWGGTEIESWTSKQSLTGIEAFSEELKKLDTDPEVLKAREKALYEQWQAEVSGKDSGMANGTAVWAEPAYDDAAWDEVPVPGLWENHGYKDIDGIMWYRTSFTLTPEEAKSPALLSLGPIDDSDMSFINGHLVGSSLNAYSRYRKYEVPQNLLVAGENTLTVRVEDYGGGGGIYGNAEELYIETNQKSIPLPGIWKCKLSLNEIPPLPTEMASTHRPNDLVTSLFNAMINPLIPYSIRGAIWYQGEANASRAWQYRSLFPLLINDWRNHWGYDFHFLWVQLANFMATDSLPSESAWAELREAQTMTLNLPNTAQAVAIDIGDANDIHPRNKQEVGRRLALGALHKAYGKEIVYSGPVFQTMTVDGSAAILTFDHVANGLKIKNKYGYLMGFSIAGSDNNFYWAKAEITGKNTVKVYCDKVEKPVKVRYAWGNNPDDAGLYNSENLPACPFRTDNQDGITKNNQ